MAKKKKPAEKNDTSFRVRCQSKDVKAFRAAADSEGFGTNLSAWILYHLRRQAKGK